LSDRVSVAAASAAAASAARSAASPASVNAAAKEATRRSDRSISEARLWICREASSAAAACAAVSEASSAASSFRRSRSDASSAPAKARASLSAWNVIARNAADWCSMSCRRRIECACRARVSERRAAKDFFFAHFLRALAMTKTSRRERFATKRISSGVFGEAGGLPDSMTRPALRDGA
jgi:hypothetical protein